MKDKETEKCTVINCNKILKEGDYVTIQEKKYCKECAVLIVQEEMKLLSTFYISPATQLGKEKVE
ncbi:MAG: hypothetical protein QW279_15925 [Candidatus Jordarchaeaceae archaeon]